MVPMTRLVMLRTGIRSRIALAVTSLSRSIVSTVTCQMGKKTKKQKKKTKKSSHHPLILWCVELFFLLTLILLAAKRFICTAPWPHCPTGYISAADCFSCYALHFCKLSPVLCSVGSLIIFQLYINQCFQLKHNN